jgi:general secretion pathway protein F
MPFFQYKAVTPAGEVKEGVLEASSDAMAIARVRDMGFIPIRAAEAGAAKGAVQQGRRPLFARKGVTTNDIGIITRELSTLLKAGLPSTAASRSSSTSRPRRALPSSSPRSATTCAAACRCRARSTTRAASSRASTST